MPTAVVEDLDYADLLKDEVKNVNLKLPRGVNQGSVGGIEQRIIDAAVEADPGYTGQSLEIGNESYEYIRSRRGYGGTYKYYTKATYTRPYTDEEIEKSGATIWKAVKKRRAAAAKKRAANLRKLKQLQRDLGLDITNVEA